jgi:hypothetical protein
VYLALELDSLKTIFPTLGFFYIIALDLIAELSVEPGILTEEGNCEVLGFLLVHRIFVFDVPTLPFRFNISATLCG